MIVHSMVDGPARNEWRNDYRRHSHSELGKLETMMIILRCRSFVARADGVWRSHMVEEATVLVMGDNQQAFVPVR